VTTSRGQAQLLAATVVFGVLAIAALREVSTASSEMTAADEEARKGHWPEAIAHARSAAEAVAPWSQESDQGFRRLESIGRDAAARGDDSTARLAYAAMRTAALETRLPWSDRADWADRAREGLLRLRTDAAR
jgi:hypothetical protein